MCLAKLAPASDAQPVRVRSGALRRRTFNQLARREKLANLANACFTGIGSMETRTQLVKASFRDTRSQHRRSHASSKAPCCQKVKMLLPRSLPHPVLPTAGVEIHASSTHTADNDGVIEPARYQPAGCCRRATSQVEIARILPRAKAKAKSAKLKSKSKSKSKSSSRSRRSEPKSKSKSRSR